jgi:hypothetical protein
VSQNQSNSWIWSQLVLKRFISDDWFTHIYSRLWFSNKLKTWRIWR